MSNDFVCSICDEPPMLACSCESSSKLFCAYHFTIHIGNQTISHTPLTLTQYQTASNYSHSTTQKLTKLSSKLSEYESQLEFHLLTISTLQDSVVQAIQHIFSQESQRYTQALPEVKSKRNLIESNQQMSNSNCDILLSKFAANELPGILENYSPIRPLNLYDIISQLLKAFNLNQDELFTYFQNFSNQTLPEDYRQLLTAKDEVITDLRHQVDTILTSSLQANTPSNTDFPAKPTEEFKQTSNYTIHTDSVTAVTITSDNSYVISGSEDNSIKRWNLRTKQLDTTFIGHSRWVACLRLTSDSELLISSSHDKSIRVWNMHSKSLEGVMLGHNDSVVSIAVCKYNLKIVTGSYDCTIKVWSLQSRSVIATVNVKSCVLCVEVSVDSKHVFVGCNDKTVRIISLDSLQECGKLVGNTRGINSIAAMNDGKHIITGGDSAVRIWNIQDQSEISQLINHTSSIHSVSISRDGRYILSASNDRTIKVWRSSDRSLLATLSGHTDCVNDVCISKDSKYIVSGSDDRSVRVWSCGF